VVYSQSHGPSAAYFFAHQKPPTHLPTSPKKKSVSLTPNPGRPKNKPPQKTKKPYIHTALIEMDFNGSSGAVVHMQSFSKLIRGLLPWLEVGGREDLLVFVCRFFVQIGWTSLARASGLPCNFHCVGSLPFPFAQFWGLPPNKVFSVGPSPQGTSVNDRTGGGCLGSSKHMRVRSLLPALVTGSSTRWPRSNTCSLALCLFLLSFYPSSRQRSAAIPSWLVPDGA